MMCLGKINFTELSRLFSYLPQYCDKQEGGRKGGIKKEKKVLVESASKKKKKIYQNSLSVKNHVLCDFNLNPSSLILQKSFYFMRTGLAHKIKLVKSNH